MIKIPQVSRLGERQLVCFGKSGSLSMKRIVVIRNVLDVHNPIAV